MIKTVYYKTLGYLIPILKTYNPQDTTLIFSDPRGGGTWLSELLLKQENKQALIWEPLHPQNKSIFTKKLRFSSRQYIPVHSDWKEAKNAFESLLKGNILVQNSFFISKPFHFLISSKLIPASLSNEISA